jgi:hypothetical protein
MDTHIDRNSNSTLHLALCVDTDTTTQLDFETQEKSGGIILAGNVDH